MNQIKLKKYILYFILNIHLVGAVNINVQNAGEICSIVSKGDKKSIVELKITGQIDARDFLCLRDEFVNLTYLDLEDAAIVEYIDTQGVFSNKKFPANEIPEYSFYNGDIGNTKLSEVILPISLVSIGRYAFYSCKNLEVVKIHKNVNSINSTAFLECVGMIQFVVNPDNKKYSSKEGVLYNFNQTILIQCPARKKNVFVIPASVNTINSSSCSGCKYLNEIVISGLVKSIGAKSFSGCTRLLKINIPESVLSIGNYAFLGCVSLEEITLPSAMKEINKFTFCGCVRLKSVTFSNSINVIGDYAFSDCKSLSGQIELPNSLVSIGNGAFSGCDGLDGVLVPNNVISIGNGAFENCSRIKGKFIVPNSIMIIGNNAFRNCSNITSVTLPNSIKHINSFSFSGCSKLQEVNLPDELISIGNGAFEFCQSLYSIVLPFSLKSIGSKVFYKCKNISSIYLKSGNPVNIDECFLVFDGINTHDCILYVPTGSKSIYELSDGWDYFININEY